MATQPTEQNYWRTVSSAAKYVDSETGSDATGDGSAQKPYQTLTMADSTSATLIICRGRFSEDMSKGNHTKKIQGDYLGAATFDGADKFIIYGYGHANMIIMNCPKGTSTTEVNTGSGLLAGCGRAGTASRVGSAYTTSSVYGLYGSSNIILNCAMYWGAIANYTGQKCVYAKLKAAEEDVKGNCSLIWLGTDKSGTLYDVPVTKRVVRYYAYDQALQQNMLYSKVAMIANNPKITYSSCFFAGDVEWYVFSAKTYNPKYDAKLNIDVELLKAGDPNQIFREAIDQAVITINEKLTADGKQPITVQENAYPVFEDCLFSKQIDTQLFNNPAKDDYTLKVSLDHSQTNNDAVLPTGAYYGALPPAINIPIGTAGDAGSDGVTSCWDNRTITGGLIEVTNDHTIALNDRALQSPDIKIGEIQTKIIVINPEVLQISGVYSQYMSQFVQQHVYLNEQDRLFKTEAGDTQIYEPDTLLEEGTYISIGKNGLNYLGQIPNGALISQGKAFFVTAADVASGTNKFLKYDEDSKAVKVKDPNIMNACYCRCRAMIYDYKKTHELVDGGVYFNNGKRNISYMGRTIIPGESFVAKNGVSSFTMAEEPQDPNYAVGAVFDYDDLSKDVWVPAHLLGEYFVSKKSGAIEKDEDGIPLGSGNYKSYSKKLSKTIINQIFLQLKFVVRRW